jgi:hypothetical protein
MKERRTLVLKCKWDNWNPNKEQVEAKFIDESKLSALKETTKN